MAGGALAGKVANSVVGTFIEDDAEKMVNIIQDTFTDIASEYLLNNKEAEKSIDKLRDKLDGKTLKNMYASDNKGKYARNLLIPIVENEVSKREKINKVTNDQMKNSLIVVLEEISDMLENDVSLNVIPT